MLVQGTIENERIRGAYRFGSTAWCAGLSLFLARDTGHGWASSLLLALTFAIVVFIATTTIKH
jgi:hypothetical protein